MIPPPPKTVRVGLPAPPPKRDVYGRLPSEVKAEQAPPKMGGCHFPFGWNLASEADRAAAVAANRLMAAT